MAMKNFWQLTSAIILITLLGTSLNFGQDLNSFIMKGDSLFKVFDNEGALEIYKKADVKYPDNWEILWRISRCYVDIGEHMPSSTDEQEEAQIAKYNMALEYADKAVQVAPEESVPYIRRAIANGRIALFKGVFSVADVVNSVRDDCEKAIELKSANQSDMAVAHYVLGRTHDKISDKWAPARSVLGLGWADYDSAIVHYKKAIELKPNFIMFYLDYAKALMEEDEFEAAKENLNILISSPIEDEDDEQRKAEAKELLIVVEEELN
jgi:tetratricopeptide (TPR) repeat protein